MTKPTNPLYHLTPGQSSPNPAFLELDCGTGGLHLDWNASPGMTPMNVWHGHALRWSVPPYLTQEQCDALLADETVRTLAARITAGYSSEWDGSNHVGRLTADASDAQDSMDSYLQANYQVGDAEVWLAADYLFTNNRLCDVWPSGIPLAQAVADLDAAAQADGIIIEGSIEDELIGEARRLLDHDDHDALMANHVATLAAIGHITQDDADAWMADSQQAA